MIHCRLPLKPWHFQQLEVGAQDLTTLERRPFSICWRTRVDWCVCVGGIAYQTRGMQAHSENSFDLPWRIYHSLGYKYAGDWRARLLVRDPTKILFPIDFRSIQTMFRHLLSDYEDDRIATHVPTLHPHSEVRVFDGAMGSSWLEGSWKSGSRFGNVLVGHWWIMIQEFGFSSKCTMMDGTFNP